MSKDGLVAGVNSKCGIQSKRRCETAMNLAFVLLDWETDLTDNQVSYSVPAQLSQVMPGR